MQTTSKGTKMPRHDAIWSVGHAAEVAEAGDDDYQDEGTEEVDDEATIDQEELLAAKDGLDAKVENRLLLRYLQKQLSLHALSAMSVAQIDKKVYMHSR